MDREGREQDKRRKRSQGAVEGVSVVRERWKEEEAA
jgi:hypothetical protein